MESALSVYVCLPVGFCLTVYLCVSWIQKEGRIFQNHLSVFTGSLQLEATSITFCHKPDIERGNVRFSATPPLNLDISWQLGIINVS